MFDLEHFIGILRTNWPETIVQVYGNNILGVCPTSHVFVQLGDLK